MIPLSQLYVSLGGTLLGKDGGSRTCTKGSSTWMFTPIPQFADYKRLNQKAEYGGARLEVGQYGIGCFEDPKRCKEPKLMDMLNESLGQSE